MEKGIEPVWVGEFGSFYPKPDSTLNRIERQSFETVIAYIRRVSAANSTVYTVVLSCTQCCIQYGTVRYRALCTTVHNTACKQPCIQYSAFAPDTLSPDFALPQRCFQQCPVYYTLLNDTVHYCTVLYCSSRRRGPLRSGTLCPRTRGAS